MTKEKKTIKNLLLYSGLTREQYDKVKPLIASENITTLRLASIVQAIYFGASFIGSLSVQAMSDKKLVYGIGTILPIFILLIHILFSRKHSQIVPWLVICFSGGVYLTGLLCTLVCTPNEMTLLLLIFFFCIPMIYIIRPLSLCLLVLMTDIIYFVTAPGVKAQNILTIDMLDIGIFSTLSLILGVIHMIGCHRRYWLETEAIDLAELRYQAAFMDRLTETYNRNAYNKDTEQLDPSGLPEDFIYTALDINGLKTVNDTFGHVAGDELIAGAAECMKQAFAEYGKVYRVGGDEFIIILYTKSTSEGDIFKRFNQIIDSWRGSFVDKISVSYGIVTAKEVKGMTLHEVELLADKRMYQKKSEYYKNSETVRRQY